MAVLFKPISPAIHGSLTASGWTTTDGRTYWQHDCRESIDVCERTAGKRSLVPWSHYKAALLVAEGAGCDSLEYHLGQRAAAAVADAAAADVSQMTDKEWAEAAAKLFAGASTWNTGGGCYVVVIVNPDESRTVINRECICTYADRDAFEKGQQTLTIALP